MLFSLALVFLGGLLFANVAERIKLPPLCGMLICGMIAGPCGLDLLDQSLLSISPDIRKIALVIILTRAGLGLYVSELKKVGRPALLLCFVPACLEIAAFTLLAPLFLPVTAVEGLLLGPVVAAVSPALIVPRMLRLAQNDRARPVAQMVMAGASVDDVFVIVLFTSVLGLAGGQGFSPVDLLRVPVSIVLGIAAGLLSGLALGWILRRKAFAGAVGVIALLGAGLLLVSLEDKLAGVVAFSGLLAVLTAGAVIRNKQPQTADGLTQGFAGLWKGSEILLFALVGAAVDPRLAVTLGGGACAVLALALVLRMASVFVCRIKSGLPARERMFCAVSYCPKATVQAAIGGVPLAMGLACGQTVLAVAVLSILLTAPLGALAIDRLSARLYGC